MATLTTSTEQLPGSRARVAVEVASVAVERELRSTAEALGRDMKLPGFRKGKVPAQMVIQRVGRESVLDQAIRQSLPGWYDEAIRDAAIVPVGSPSVDMNKLPETGASLAFSFEVGVRPTAKLGALRGIEVGRREPEVPDAEVDAQLERVRESLASLETVDRAAANGDFAVVDFTGYVDGEPFEGGDARGYLLELGAGRLIPGFEEQVVGTSAGEEAEVDVSFPADYQAEHLVGKAARFAVSVKEVKEKRLPELDDDLAVEAGGYESLAELREEVRKQLEEAAGREIERKFREAAVDAVAADAQIEIPHGLVHAKAHEMWQVTSRRLQAEGITPEQYLQMTNKTEEQLVVESEPEAEQALRREATLAAVIEAESIEVSDEELLDSLRRAATQPGQKEPSEKALQRQVKKARSEGTEAPLREDIAMRKAVDLIVEHATPIEAERAAARDELWTPAKDADQSGSDELWTPGS